MKKNTRFPLFIDLKDKPVIVFGGGKIATRRVETLLDFKARVIVVAPEVSERISQLEETDARIQIIYAEFDDWNNAGGFDNGQPLFVLACTNDSGVNGIIAKYARAYGIMTNVCDDASNCDFYFPAIVRDDEFVMGITGDGIRHSKVKEFAEKLRKFLGKK